VSTYPKGTTLFYRGTSENMGASLVTFTVKEKGTEPNSFNSLPFI